MDELEHQVSEEIKKVKEEKWGNRRESDLSSQEINDIQHEANRRVADRRREEGRKLR